MRLHQNLDSMPPPAHLGPEFRAKVFIQTQLTDFGQVLEAFMGIDDRYSFSGPELSIVHLAAVPAPGRVPDQVVFQNNVISTYNVFEAARKLKIKNIISASSETMLGLPMVSDRYDSGWSSRDLTKFCGE
jgi:nucleoside-diphosphate-sugar epimerase